MLNLLQKLQERFSSNHHTDLHKNSSSLQNLLDEEINDKKFADLRNLLRSLPKYRTSKNFGIVLKSLVRREMAIERQKGLITSLNFRLRIPVYLGAALTCLAVGIIIGRMIPLETDSSQNYSGYENSPFPAVQIYPDTDQAAQQETTMRPVMRNFVIEVASPSERGHNDQTFEIATEDNLINQYFNNIPNLTQQQPPSKTVLKETGTSIRF
jgi:hypothetical protein